MADFGIGEALAAIGLSGGEAAGAAGAAGATTLFDAAGAVLPASAAGTAAVAGASGGGTVAALTPLSEIGTAASLIGTGISAKAGLDNAAYQKSLAQAESEALAQKANEDAAAGERQAITRQRQTDLVLSRSRALAAGSGTDAAASPDIVTGDERIAGQGEYNALSSLYEGQTKAQSDNYQGQIDLFKGQRIADTAPLAAAGTILAGLGSFATNRAQMRYYTKIGAAPYGAL